MQFHALHVHPSETNWAQDPLGVISVKGLAAILHNVNILQ